MKRFEAVVVAIDMTNNALIPCPVMLLGHLLLHSLVRLHCLLIRLLRTASSAHALHCTHSFICSSTCYGGYELNALISFSFNPLWHVHRGKKKEGSFLLHHGANELRRGKIMHLPVGVVVCSTVDFCHSCQRKSHPSREEVGNEMEMCALCEERLVPVFARVRMFNSEIL